MAEERDKKGGAFRQILVSVVIALLVGGSAPWWWKIVSHGCGPSPDDGSLHRQSSLSVSPTTQGQGGAGHSDEKIDGRPSHHRRRPDPGAQGGIGTPNPPADPSRGVTPAPPPPSTPIRLTGTALPGQTVVLLQEDMLARFAGVVRFRFSAPAGGPDYMMGFCIGHRDNPCGTATSHVVNVPGGGESLDAVDASFLKDKILTVGHSTNKSLPYSVTIE
jgi:hypothetical protein